MHDPHQEQPETRESAGQAGRRWPVRRRTVIAATAVAVLALGGTVAYAASSGGSPTPPGTSASSSPSPGGPDGRHERGGPGFGFGAAVHGEATVKDPDTGRWVVRIWQRGTVQKVSGDQVTVRSEDGASWTWTVGSDALVRGGTPKQGDTVVLIGTLDHGKRTALRALTGDFDERGPDHWRDGFRHHDWNDDRDDSPTPTPSGDGAST
ncbi:hypothetical protein C3489_29775 [Streptomyces sp. Ru71]|uniref:hypothetical protein n=1 Tax=Streptomyces sp. Ru71 TaxID=2080746 RepID=UPI000CDE2952|nr:hypothetical protein [Streptomyces sp. Ru71]POX47397.1 hypothetical protein C3489_29775 [Streptomyces sp. Ru71]